MSDSHNEEPDDPSVDLPPELLRSFTMISHSGDSRREEHISVALSVLVDTGNLHGHDGTDGENVSRATVTHIGARRASFLTAAAAAIALIGGVVGWRLNSPAGQQPFSADQALVAENGRWSSYPDVPGSDATRFAASGTGEPLTGDSSAVSGIPGTDVPAKGAPTKKCAVSLVAGAVIIGEISTDGKSYLVVQLGKKITLYSDEDCSVFVTYDLP